MTISLSRHPPASRQGSNDVCTLGDQGILRRLIATTMIMMLWWMMLMMRWKVTTMMMTKGGCQHKHIPSICVASSNTILGQEQRYDICRSEEGTKVRCIFEIIYYILYEEVRSYSCTINHLSIFYHVSAHFSILPISL